MSPFFLLQLVCYYLILTRVLLLLFDFFSIISKLFSVLPILKVLSELIPGVELESVYAEIEKEGTDLHKMISSLLEKTVAEKKGKVPFGMYG